MPWAVTSRSFSSRTRSAGISDASRRSSTTHGRFVVVTRPSTTGPAMPIQAASIRTGGPSARKRAMAASSEAKSWLGSGSSRTSAQPAPRGSNRASVVLVPPTSPARITLFLRPRVDAHDRREELQRLWLLPLERVASDDRAEAAAIADGADLVEDLLVLGGGAARENDGAAAVEGRLHDVPDALGERADRHLRRFVDLFRRRLLEVRRRQLDLDDVRAELRGDVGGVRRHVDGRFTVLGEAGAARVRPDDDRHAGGLGFLGHRADLLVHRQAML